MKVGFIGLGTMGASMAANLQKAGYDVVVHDIRRAAAELYLAAGAGPDVVRLSIGLETAEDLIRDLDEALAATAA